MKFFRENAGKIALFLLFGLICGFILLIITKLIMIACAWTIIVTLIICLYDRKFCRRNREG